jgi:hypothetical protein
VAQFWNPTGFLRMPHHRHNPRRLARQTPLSSGHARTGDRRTSRPRSSHRREVPWSAKEWLLPYRKVDASPDLCAEWFGSRVNLGIDLHPNTHWYSEWRTLNISCKNDISTHVVNLPVGAGKIDGFDGNRERQARFAERDCGRHADTPRFHLLPSARVACVMLPGLHSRLCRI